MKAPALEIRDLSVEYPRKGEKPVRAVAGVDLTVEYGQIVGLVGESGCGKSTLAKAAVGLLPPAQGDVYFEGEKVEPLRRRARPPAQRRLQMVFQDPQSSLNPRRSVEAQIADGLKLGSTTLKDDWDSRISQLLEQVGLASDARYAYPHQFSGGQRQRICIARALAADPRVLVADEPISALDASAQAQIANLLLDLTRELNIALLFISHDLSIVREIADRVAVMYLGKIAEEGTPLALWSQPLHPYTKALIEAVPTVGGSGQLPADLGGEVPDPAAPPKGCRFNTRCAYRFDKCSDEPDLIGVTPNHFSACWLNEVGKPWDLMGDSPPGTDREYLPGPGDSSNNASRAGRSQP